MNVSSPFNFFQSCFDDIFLIFQIPMGGNCAPARGHSRSIDKQNMML